MYVVPNLTGFKEFVLYHNPLSEDCTKTTTSSISSGSKEKWTYTTWIYQMTWTLCMSACVSNCVCDHLRVCMCGRVYLCMRMRVYMRARVRVCACVSWCGCFPAPLKRELRRYPIRTYS